MPETESWRPRTALEIAVEKAERIAAELPAVPIEPVPIEPPPDLVLQIDEIHALAQSERCLSCGHLIILHGDDFQLRCNVCDCYC